MIERVVAYEPNFDRKAYHEVKNREKLDAYTKRQLETHLGERFNVLLSETRYEIQDGQIFGENTSEPFMQMLQRGVDYRRLYGNPTDFEREKAEILGFEKIQQTLTSEEAETGTMLVSISPSGLGDSIYKHNFYDVFTLKQDEKVKYIQAIRYSSSLDIGEYVEKLKPIKSYETTPKDSDFLKEPIKIDTYFLKTADDIHKYFHKDHEYITKEEFDEILDITTPLITSYINTLSEKPFDENLQLLTYNAILNKADIALELVKDKDKNGFAKDYLFQSQFTLKNEIYGLGAKPVRVVSTGCGASGGFLVASNLNAASSPFSVSEFGNKKQEQEWFSCPKCKYKADGPVGDTCPGCRLTKEEFAKSGGKIC